MTLTHTHLRRIIGEAALKANIHADCVIYLTRGKGSRIAKEIMRALLADGCSGAELARVWGCEPSTVWAAKREGDRLKPVVQASPKPLDAFTAERLRWRYGEARAAQIVAGRDPKTIADLAAWRRVGSRLDAERRGL